MNTRSAPVTETKLEAFGLTFRCEFRLDRLPEGSLGPVDVSVTLTTIPNAVGSFSGPVDPPIVRMASLGDGGTYRTERGRDGDHLITYDDIAAFHISADRRAIRCGPVVVDDVAWRRFLLDTVFGMTSLLHGFEALHAGAWVGPVGVVAVVAGAGGGKSTLLAEMVRRGHVMFCDDILALSARDRLILGHSGPPLMNLPPSLPDGTMSDRFGSVLGSFGDELWISIDRAAVPATPLAGVVFLERTSALATRVEELAPSSSLLLRHSLQGDLDQARLAARFDLFSELARQARLCRVVAPLDVPSSEMADLLEDWLACNVFGGAS
jgi:hypothetical protein